MLQQVLDYIEKNGVFYAERIASDLKLDLEDVKFALDFWEKKGKFTHRDICKTCTLDCGGCGIGKKS